MVNELLLDRNNYVTKLNFSQWNLEKINQILNTWLNNQALNLKFNIDSYHDDLF